MSQLPNKGDASPLDPRPKKYLQKWLGEVLINSALWTFILLYAYTRVTIEAVMVALQVEQQPTAPRFKSHLNPMSA